MVSPRFLAAPPSPPKEDVNSEINDALELLDDPYGTKQLLGPAAAADIQLNTPEQSPLSDADSVSSSSRKKRVNFELQTCAIPKSSPLVSQPWTPRHSSPLRPLPQTRVSRPLKSILKPSDATSTPPQPAEDAAPAHQTFAEMLESVVKMLAQGARPSKLDAYTSLLRTMQAYEKIPDVDALNSKMGLLAQFIRRDMQAVSISGSGPDSQLVQQALKFLMALLRITEVKHAMDDDFCSFVVDRCVDVGCDATMPKAVVNTHLAVLMQQNFRPRVVTTARAEKILDFLDTIHERVSGLSVQAYRIRIYRKLIMQKPDTMIKHTERWFKFLLKAMLSSSNEIHQSALDTALTAVKAIGSDRNVVKAILTILNRIKHDGEPFVKPFAQQLEKLLKSDTAPLVPQIWSTITAFLRDSLVKDDTLQARDEWLTVLENCFKSEVEAVRLHANVAVAFMTYAVHLTEQTPESWTQKLLTLPRNQMKNHPRRCEIDAATSAYFTLLYYAFQANASHAQLKRYWLEFVADFWGPLVPASSSYAVAACRTLSALFRGSKRPWNEHRALELKVQSMIQRPELPHLDSRWVRKDLATVLDFVEKLLDATPWTSDAVDDEPVKTMWVSLLDSLVEAGSKEVMATSETKDAIAHVVNMLRRMWDKHTAELALSQQKEDSWADKFCFLIESILQKLGPLQFADKCLTRNLEDEFQVAPTPSGRSRHNGPRLSPLLYFLDLLVLQSEGKLSDPVRLRIVQRILEPCLAIQNTRLAKLDLLRDCSAAVAAVEASSSNTVSSKFWDQVAALARSTLCEQPSDSKERMSRQFGKEYEAAAAILAIGSAHFLASSSGPELLKVFVETVCREAGYGAVALAVVEKVSSTILEARKELFKGYLSYATILLLNLPPQMSRRIADQGRQLLYPSSPASGKTQDHDPYNFFYRALIPIGTTAYHDLELDKAESTRAFLSALALSIEKCPVSLLGVYLRRIHAIVTLWIKDPEQKLRCEERSTTELRHEVVNLWQKVCKALEKFQKRESSLLVALEPLLCAGFSCRRRDIANMTVIAWNNTFGKEETLKYPAALEHVLRRLGGHIDALSLPGLKNVADKIDDALSFDSDSSANAAVEARSLVPKPSPFRASKSTRKSHSPAVNSSARRRVSSRTTPKIRLRHDNSQIQFEPIVSSPNNPFNQESQVLTERQKEMIERQKATSGLFSKMAPPGGSQPRAISPDELPTHSARTPLKGLASMGPMDVYLGSSPTPRSRTPLARTRSQQIVSDETDLATPNAVRTIQNIEDSAELGSSPPQFEKVSGRLRAALDNDRQPDRSYSDSFDAGTTFDEDMLAVNDATPRADAPHSDDASSTIELQIDAQLNADLDARRISSTMEESNNIYLDAQSHRKSPDNEETPRASRSKGNRMGDVGPSPMVVVKEEPVDEKSQSQSQSQSTELATSSQPHAKRKRGRPPKSAKNKKAKTQDVLIKTDDASTPAIQTRQRKSAAAGATPVAVEETPVAATASAKSQGKRKRGRPSTKSVFSSQSIVPETVRKPSDRTPTSSFTSSVGQDEPTTNEDEVMAELTPVPKRARKGTNADVSEAKIQQGPASQCPQVSRARASSRASSRRSSLAAEGSSMVAEAAQQEATQQVDVDAPEQQTADIVTPVKPTCDQSQPTETQRAILTPRSILAKLKDLKTYISQMVLGREEEREFDDALFHLRVAVHDAARGERPVEYQ